MRNRRLFAAVMASLSLALRRREKQLGPRISGTKGINPWIYCRGRLLEASRVSQAIAVVLLRSQVDWA